MCLVISSLHLDSTQRRTENGRKIEGDFHVMMMTMMMVVVIVAVVVVVGGGVIREHSSSSRGVPTRYVKRDSYTYINNISIKISQQW